MDDKKILKKDFISVVMSNYNTPIKYLKESIDSVLNQTYSNFEFIIIDDGSTDDSLEFIKSYDDPRIRLIVNEENIGLTKSLNKGLEAAQGEYIARMDSDDICYPERFEKQIEYMKEHPDTIVCGTWADVIDENGNVQVEKWARQTINNMDEYRINLLFENKPLLIHPSSFINNQLLIDYNIKYNENYRYAQDYDMWVKCSKYANCYIYPHILLKFRQHENNISNSKAGEQYECAIQIIQEQLKLLNLSLTDDLKPLHYRFLFERKPYNSKIKKWLRTIIKANKTYNIYNQRKLKNILWYRWSKVCHAEICESSLLRRIQIILPMSFVCKLNLFKIQKRRHR